MKILIKKGIIFLLLFISCLVAAEYLSIKDEWRYFFAEITDSKAYIEGNVGSDEIIPYIRKVQKQDETRELILGDSVCYQLMNGLQTYNEDKCIVGSNGAITMAGQYILCDEYLSNHHDITDVYLFVLPESLQRTFDTKWGYQYTVLPFALTDTLDKLDSNTLSIMSNVYGKWFLRKDIAYLIDSSAINRKIYLNLLKEYGSSYVQPGGYDLADQYIHKMFELCEKKNVSFHLCPCPVSDYKKETIREQEKSYQNTWLSTVFPEYFDSIYYIPDEWTRDHTHLGGEYANQETYNQIIDEWLPEGQSTLKLTCSG